MKKVLFALSIIYIVGSAIPSALAQTNNCTNIPPPSAAQCPNGSYCTQLTGMPDNPNASWGWLCNGQAPPPSFNQGNTTEDQREVPCEQTESDTLESSGGNLARKPICDIYGCCQNALARTKEYSGRLNLTNANFKKAFTSLNGIFKIYAGKSISLSETELELCVNRQFNKLKPKKRIECAGPPARNSILYHFEQAQAVKSAFTARNTILAEIKMRCVKRNATTQKILNQCMATCTANDNGLIR